MMVEIYGTDVGNADTTQLKLTGKMKAFFDSGICEVELYLVALDDFGRVSKTDLFDIFSRNISVPAGQDSNAF